MTFTLLLAYVALHSALRAHAAAPYCPPGNEDPSACWSEEDIKKLSSDEQKKLKDEDERFFLSLEKMPIQPPENARLQKLKADCASNAQSKSQYERGYREAISGQRYLKAHASIEKQFPDRRVCAGIPKADSLCCLAGATHGFQLLGAELSRRQDKGGDISANCYKNREDGIRSANATLSCGPYEPAMFETPVLLGCISLGFMERMNEADAGFRQFMKRFVSDQPAKNVPESIGVMTPATGGTAERASDGSNRK